MPSVLFEVGPTDPLTYVVVVAGFAAAILLACAVPSRRAVSIAPVRAIGLD
jgi:ABC-type lipoprotein release transport system permease subunit